MNKFTVPSVLLATVMVAGMFAFMPVEQASTVHATTDGITSAVQYRTDSVTCTSTGVNDDCLITISSSEDYLVWNVSLDMSAFDAGDVADFEDIEIGGINFLLGDNVAQKTFTNAQTVPIKSFNNFNCSLGCALNIPAQGGTDITFEIDVTALDDASESIPIVVYFLTTSDAAIDVQSTT